MSIRKDLEDPCPCCGKISIKLDEERDHKGPLFSITCYAWCGLGSQRFRTKDMVFRWFKNRKLYTTPKNGGGL